MSPQDCGCLRGCIVDVYLDPVYIHTLPVCVSVCMYTHSALDPLFPFPTGQQRPITLFKTSLPTSSCGTDT